MKKYLQTPSPEDVERAFKQLLNKKAFAVLQAGDILKNQSVELIVDQNPDAKSIGLTEEELDANGQRTGKVFVTIFINNLEFRELKRNSPELYDQLLKEAIVHEYIHAYLFHNMGADNTLGLGHQPSRDNSVNNGFGNIGEWMRSRYPAGENKSVSDHRMLIKYNSLYLDIDPESQLYLLLIVGGKIPDPRRYR